MARRTQAESQQTRCDILQAAVHCFLEKAVAHTSLEDIARQAGYTRGAVYHHFKNKVEILLELLECVEMPFEGLFAEAHVNEPEASMETLQKIVSDVMCEIMVDEKRRAIHTILYHRCEWTPELDPVFQHMLEVKASCLQSSVPFLENAAKQGLLRTDVTPAQAALYLQTFCVGYYWRSLMAPPMPSSPEEIRTAISVIFQGLHRQEAR